MIQPLLSILIPTVIGRERVLNNLLHKIWGQYLLPSGSIHTIGKLGVLSGNEIEVLWFKDNKEITIGEKREQLYNMAIGKFSWQIDDDDDIADNAIQLILDTIKIANVDCITFEEHIDIDGNIERSNHSLIYGDWEGEGGKELWDGFHYHRTPFFKSVIKTEIARSVPIPHIRFGEDHQWSQALKPHLKSEIHIPEQLYKYIHRSSNFNERYGIPNI